MKKIVSLVFAFVSIFVLVSCQETDTRVDSFAYTDMTLPDYTSLNPVRYLDENELGLYNGWQDFGLNGEILTIAVPVMSTYSYQMYAYYIRNNLQDLYGDISLPETLSDLTTWITDIHETGSRILWYSMGRNLPDEVELVSTETVLLNSGDQSFLKAEYIITIGDATQEWIVYFMDIDGVFSSYGIRVNEHYDWVEDMTDTIVKTYQVK